MATFTDVLITADKRFRDKARVAYGFFGIATKVLDAGAAERYAGGVINPGRGW